MTLSLTMRRPIYIKKKDIVVGNFLGGLAWGVGSVIGATIVVAILLGILGQLNFIPGVADLVNSIKPPQTKSIAK